MRSAGPAQVAGRGLVPQAPLGWTILSKRLATQPWVEPTDVADVGAMHARVPKPEGVETTPLQGGRDGGEAEGGLLSDGGAAAEKDESESGGVSGPGGEAEGESDAMPVEFVGEAEGTMIGKAVKRQKYMAPHDLKLSQAFKMRGMSQKNMAFLAAIRVCWGDRVRYSREKLFERVADESLLSKDPLLAISVSWDNNDTDPHAALGTAEHLSQISACAHQATKQGLPTLGLESLWKKIKNVTLASLKKGARVDEHDSVIDGWNCLLLGILGNSPRCLSEDGEEQSCLEIKIQDKHTAPECKVASRNLFLEAGSTKRLADNEAALERIQRSCHAGVVWEVVDGRWRSTVSRRVLVEGDEETYRIMVQLKKGNPEKYKWMVPHPGGWHIMLHVTKALMTRYYRAGIEVVAKALGGDDVHAAASSKYRRSHHLLTVTNEVLWWILIERYLATNQKEAGEEPTGAAPPAQPVDTQGDVVPWLKEQVKEHNTLRLWATFLLDDYPTYLMFRTGGRTANYKLCVAAFRKMAPLFAATGKNRYQQLSSWHLLTLARMTDPDLEAVASLFSSQFNTKNYRNFNNVFLDEMQEMMNRVVKQNLGRITQAYMTRLPLICDSRPAAVDDVDASLYPSYKERDVRRAVISARVGPIRKAKAVLEGSFAFSDEGKDQMRSLGGAVTTARKAEAMLNANEIAERKFDAVLKYEALGDKIGGTKPSTSKIPFFPPENTSLKASTAPTSTAVARKDFRDMTLLATEFWKIIKSAVMEGGLTEEERNEIMASFGVVLPMALSRSGDGGAYTINKAAWANWAFDTFCPDAIQEEAFYNFDGFAYDWATDLHRSPPVGECQKGASAPGPLSRSDILRPDKLWARGCRWRQTICGSVWIRQPRGGATHQGRYAAQAS
ncbi:unnamed protein product [Ectocarpus sp. 12 AP-2014]